MKQRGINRRAGTHPACFFDYTHIFCAHNGSTNAVAERNPRSDKNRKAKRSVCGVLAAQGATPGANAEGVAPVVGASERSVSHDVNVAV